MRNMPGAQSRINRIIQQREYLFTQLDAISWLEPYPSQANFILCYVQDGSAPMIKERLRRQGILIRYFEKPKIYFNFQTRIWSS